MSRVKDAIRDAARDTQQVREVRGLLGEKIGMTQVWDDQHRLVPVTVLRAGPCVVTQVRTPDVDGYSAIQIAYGGIDPRKVNKPEGGHFEKAGVAPRRHLVEVRTADASTYELGQELTAEAFEVGEKIDVTGTSKAHGTSGVMKRHNFHGTKASHGVHKVHRAPGAIGGAAFPGRVFKGQKMAGRMGGAQVTTSGLRIHDIDTEKGLILVRGSVPGVRGGVVLIRNAAKGAK